MPKDSAFCGGLNAMRINLTPVLSKVKNGLVITLPRVNQAVGKPYYPIVYRAESEKTIKPRKKILNLNFGYSFQQIPAACCTYWGVGE
jgi:hypothetical protein